VSIVLGGTIAKILSIIGLIAVLYVVGNVFKVLSVHFLKPSKSFAKYKGKWAVVSGASWGIGYGFSLELASRGLNIVLMARSKERLDEIASEIEQKYQVKTRVIVVDFGSNQPIYKTIEEQTKDLEVSVLINNVGIAPPDYLLYFHEFSEELLDTMVRVNISSQNHLTRIFLPKMLERKSGAIINLSSTSGLDNVATGLFSVYAATKAYNNKLSTSMAEEYEGRGVDILSVTPGFVTSKMTRMRTTNWYVCSETGLAKATLDKLGYHYWSIIPVFRHVVFQYLLSHGGPWIRKMKFDATLQTRKAAMKKIMERKAAESKNKSD